jgi:predicted GNAT family acetyltransferase
MTELLHPVRTSPAPTTAPVESRSTRSLADLPAGHEAPESQTARHGRDTTLLDDRFHEDLAARSTRHLRVMANQAFKLMDTEHPPAGAMEHYEAIVDKLECRARQAATRGFDSAGELKETFRDNALYCRFELIIDGALAAWLKYTMSGARIVLLDGVEQPGFQDQGIGATLMRHVVLNAHKRRLSLTPRCPMASAFFADNPQYRLLAGRH